MSKGKKYNASKDNCRNKSKKGGCGKTNIAVNLAGTMVRRGHKVKLIDADPQGTATIWVNNADPDSPIQIEVNGLGRVAGSVTKEIKKSMWMITM
ncbi:AAA family ATPase [Undibacterium arcticum]